MVSAQNRISQIVARLSDIESQRIAILEVAKLPRNASEQNSLEARKCALEAKQAAVEELARSVRSMHEAIQSRQESLQATLEEIKVQARSAKTASQKDAVRRDAEAYDRERDSFKRDVETYEQNRQSLMQDADSHSHDASSLERDGEAYNRQLKAEMDAAVSQVNSLFAEQAELQKELRRLQEWRSQTWDEPVGGGDSAGNPVTVSFGEGSHEHQTMIADGDQTDSRDDEVQSFTAFREHENHSHYGSGDGPHENAKDRGKYTGPGH